MFINKYALAVETDDNLFEIFDILYFEKGTEIDLRYQQNIANKAIGIHSTIRNGIKIGAIFDNDKFIYESTEDTFDIAEDENIYLFLSDNKVFGFIINQKEDPADKKYQAAFSSKVILIDISLEQKVGFGDLWNGQEIIQVI